MTHEPLVQRLLQTGAATQDETTLARRGGDAGVLALARSRERPLCESLAQADRHPALVLSESTLQLSAADLIPEQISRAHLLLPVAVDDETLTLAVASTELGQVLNQVAFASGRRVTLLLAVRELLPASIEAAYTSRRLGVNVLKGERASDEEPRLEVVRFVEPKGEASVAGLMAGLRGSLQLLRGAAAVRSSPHAAAEEVGEGAAPAPVLPPEPVVMDALEEAPEPGRPLALVVEDDEDVRALVVRVLRADGWNVLEAASGTEAVAHLRRGKPALVVLDAMLPGMHGFEVCSRIKSSAYRDVPVIMVSAMYRGWQQARDVQERYGADAFLEKPFNVGYLRRLAAGWVGREPEPVELSDERRAVAAQLRREAETHARAGSWQEAIASARRWLDVNPFDAAGQVLLGNALVQVGALDFAMRAYEAALVCDPRSFSAAVNLASSYERLGFARKSEETWRKARALAPDDTAREMIDARLVHA